ncbi:hypothetical protein ACIPRL_35590 [Streptomyces sp. NPDC090085]|uniref:hypothetical protein n=1 Tax=Streptomyces sp. NPDC090085 TaxID=3365943 RepID=UPI00381427E0
MTTPPPSTPPPSTPVPATPAVAPEPIVPGPLLTGHAALIFLMAAFIGAMVGVLTAFSAGNTAAALLAGLTACGISIPILHKLIH